ncbi:hypothetical protein BKK79_21390 [Cupriavidus sp. USMAA2-4]|uniref:Uncharacterized protein n=1 Tax=Cupriavidus malaysiensis TaxID=367825 RepID=A0ABN4TRX6_9BURK|nr:MULTISPECIES: zinc-finger-containing protein [Cupriavidus]AOY94502.1 hypothetical protein BKK79_21390 [Cupriavidus sp. USMAA2-4]AOZ02637.1 hypothetical protein BKK81_25865 [Cupriavidus sp. USMAHM13]AOZ09997.1 hypothetical protein BKK80_30485 [Cupriavidus malaysiensis]
MRVGRPIPAPPQPVCDFCGAKAVLMQPGESAYPYRDDHGPLWVCTPCEAWIGTYPRSKRHVPLGRLANAELRQAKSELHQALEPLVAAKMRRDGCRAFEARAKGIRWLAAQLGLADTSGSIHAFDAAQCRQAIGLIGAFLAQRRGAAGEPGDES